MRRMDMFSGALGWILCFVCLGSSLNGQSIWMGNLPNKSISIEFKKPFFAESDVFGFTTSSWFVSGKYSLPQNFVASVEFPFSYLIYDDRIPRNGEFISGNPYIGVTYLGPGKNISADIGLRLPLSPDIFSDHADAAAVGLVTEFVERPEAFMPDITPINIRLNYANWGDNKFFYRLQAGPSLWLAEDGADNDWLMHYSTQVGYRLEQAGLFIGFNGLWLMNSEDGSAEKNWHQLAASTYFVFGKMQPLVSVKMPLDESLSDLVEMSVSVGFNFLLN